MFSTYSAIPKTDVEDGILVSNRIHFNPCNITLLTVTLM